MSGETVVNGMWRISEVRHIDINSEKVNHYLNGKLQLTLGNAQF